MSQNTPEKVIVDGRSISSSPSTDGGSSFQHLNISLETPSTDDESYTRSKASQWFHAAVALIYKLTSHLKVLLYHLFPQLRTMKSSLLSKYLMLIFCIVVPTLFYIETSLLFEDELDFNVQSEDHLKDLQVLNMERLSEIILPPYTMIENYETYQNHREPYLFDPRLASAVWVGLLKHHIIENKGVLDPQFHIPFSWNDWVDLDRKLRVTREAIKEYIDHNPEKFTGWTEKQRHEFTFPELNCTTLKHFYKRQTNDPRDPYSKCEDLSEADAEIYKSFGYPHSFKYTGLTTEDMTTPGRILTDAAYLYHSAPPPNRLVFLGAGVNGSSVTIIPETLASNDIPFIKRRQGSLIPLLHEYLEKESKLKNKPIRDIYENGVRLVDIVEELQENYEYDPRFQNFVNHSSVLYDRSHLMQLDPSIITLESIDLQQTDFLWEESEIMSEMEKRIKTLEQSDPSFKRTQSLDDKLLKRMKSILDGFPDRNFPKFVNEPKVGTLMGDHYDWRFYSGLSHPAWTKQAILHRMGRAYLRFCYTNGIRTWIAYGTMLGWYRNGLALKWDDDIDVVMTMDSMYKLARNHNNTLIIDVTKQDKYGSGLGSYLFDIGAGFFARERGNGNNAIDGRLVDTSMGVYIDLTAVAYTKFWDKAGRNDNIFRMMDPDYNQKKKDMDSQQENDYKDKLTAEFRTLYEKKLTFHCRNHNFYKLDELTPMIPTFYEGVRTFVPHTYKRLLDRKYPDALQRNKEKNYLYKKHLRLWVEEKDCPDGDHEGELCQDERVIQEYRHTRDYTKRHVEIMKNAQSLKLKLSEETIPMRYDQFIVDYAAQLNARLD